MTRKATVIVIILALLTLSGFILVSNLMGAKRPDNKVSPTTSIQPKVPNDKRPLPVGSVPPVMRKATQDEGQMHADLVRAQELLSTMSAAVAAKDWGKVQGAFTEFESKTQHLPAPQLHYPDISPILQDFFALYQVQLEHAINEQNVASAQLAVNQLYGIVGEQRVRLGTRGVPLEFQRLRFLAREVGWWSEAGDEKMLRVRTVALRDAWLKDVRPMIAARRNGLELAKNFDQLVQRLTTAEQMPQVTALLPDFNKELDQMDLLFQRPRSTVGPRGTKVADDDQ